MSTITVKNVLGEERTVTHVYHDGSYTCPFCGCAVLVFLTYRPGLFSCQNPACEASCWASPERVLADRERHAREEQERQERLSVSASREKSMREASERYHDKRVRKFQEVIAAGQCVSCFARNGRRVRHRTLDYHTRDR